MDVFETRDELVAQSIELISDRVRSGLDRRGHAAVALSGGSTPGPVYSGLSQIDLDWENVTVALADDRWVEPGNKASNEKLVRETLLQNSAATASFLPMKTSSSRPDDAVADVALTYQVLANGLDVLVLGMGPDSHTLSWFPDANGLSEAMDPANENYVAAIQARKSEVTGDLLDRMTLTARAITEAELVLLLITGDTKKRCFTEADASTPIGFARKLAGDRFRTFWAN